MIARAASLLALLALAGCAITPATYLNNAISSPYAGAHVVSIERGKWIGAANFPLLVFVDGQPVAKMYGGQAINLYLKDGRHLIGVRQGSKAIAGSKPEREIAVDISSESRPILRAGPVAAGYGGWGIKIVN